MRLVPVCQSWTGTEGSAIADNEVALYPGTLTCVAALCSTAHVLCGHATCLVHGPSMGRRIGMEALELDTFRC